MKLRKITKKQREYYEMLIAFFESNQRMPTNAEGAEVMGFKSPSACYEKSLSLLAKGYLTQTKAGASRGYAFTEYKAVLTKINPKES